MSMTSVLPPASTPIERTADAVAEQRLARMPAIVTSLWNADTCPAPLLPYLAIALSVDEWNDGWGVDKKRAVIKESRYIHQHKGTLAAIRRALTAIGQPDATIIERGDYVFRDGTRTRDATHQRRGQGGWATYRIILSRPATVDLAYQIKRLLAAVQRNCITLTAIDYRQAALRRNGVAIRDAAWTRGVVDTTIN